MCIDSRTRLHIFFFATVENEAGDVSDYLYPLSLESIHNVYIPAHMLCGGIKCLSLSLNWMWLSLSPTCDSGLSSGGKKEYSLDPTFCDYHQSPTWLK